MAQLDLTRGPIAPTLLRFALPMVAANLFQQLYNVVDTLIVGRVLGADPLAAVGSSFALMTFLTSILLGLCMGSGAVFSMAFGAGDQKRLHTGQFVSFCTIGALAAALAAGAFLLLDEILVLLSVPQQVVPVMGDYLWVIFWGIGATFLINYFTCLLRAVGNASVPLLFLAGAAVGNVVLDLLFILRFGWGVRGAAGATVVSQWACGLGLMAYTLRCCPQLRVRREEMVWRRGAVKEIGAASALTCLQQSVMNLGILLVQGLVNSFGAGVMAAFAAGVKIDAFAYLPLQDFGNAFSSFVAQNFGAGKRERIRRGTRTAFLLALAFGLAVSAAVVIFARPLLGLFLDPGETDILSLGVTYLRVEGAFYWAIGFLFLFYGLFRAVARPGMSLVLTVVSLGTRVALAYALSPRFGTGAIWWAVPIGWGLADLVGWLRWRKLPR